MTDTTHEAPEWIFTTGNSTTGSWNSKKSKSCAFKGLRQTQYIRADLVQAAVAAALREAINRVNGCDRVSEVQPAILALITPDAQTALDRVVAAERERCAKVAESRWRSWGQNDPHGAVECDVTACENIAAAIRKGGE